MRKIRCVPIPNEIVDEHLSDLSGPELKVLLFVIRRTHGWGKERETATLESISQATGHSRSTCCEAAQRLVELKLLHVENHKTEQGSMAASTYEPNFDDESIRPSEYPIRPSEQGVFAPANVYKEENSTTVKQESNNTPPTPSEPLPHEGPEAQADSITGMVYRGTEAVPGGMIRDVWQVSPSQWCFGEPRKPDPITGEVSDHDGDPEPFSNEDVWRGVLARHKGNPPKSWRAAVRGGDFTGYRTLHEAIEGALRMLQTPGHLSPPRSWPARTSSDVRSPKAVTRFKGRDAPASPDWTADEGFARFREVYDPEREMIPADWDKAYVEWLTLTEGERASAVAETPNYLKCADGFVMGAARFLREKEFTRKHKPKISRKKLDPGEEYLRKHREAEEAAEKEWADL